MFDYSGYYTIVLALQAFCLYHAYKNNTHQKWFWLIIFIPLVGCLIYMYDTFYSRPNVNSLTEGVKELVYSNYAVEKLEKEVKYSETVTNKTNLADAYTERGRYDEAIKLYESCRKGYNDSNPDLLRKLLRAYFLTKNYEKVIELGQLLESVKSVGDSEDKIAYAWALHFTGNTPKAEEKFKALDARFANFHARTEFSKFLMEIGKTADAKKVLNAIVDDYEGMDSYEKNAKKSMVKEAKRLQQSIK
jgi:hypothetical protein